MAGSYELQWSHNGEELPGENQTLLTVNDVFATQGGTYTCSVVNVAGSGMDEGILYGMCNAIHDFRLVMHLLSIKQPSILTANVLAVNAIGTLEGIYSKPYALPLSSCSLSFLL